MIGEKINVSTFNWGPCVIRLKITDDFKKLLLSEGEGNKLDFKNKLAGIIDKETGYSEESKAKVVPYMAQYLGVYDQMFEKFVNKKYEKKPEYVLSALWINYQKANEFNPPHDHDGKLSFVTYLQIPEELKKENADYVGKSCGPGGIQFMFIFPAWLKHWVAPYKSDCTRISVSGNIHDSAPLNAIRGFAPEYLKDKNKNK